MMNYSSSKLSVKDSFEDEEGSDDVEDEVFIRDGRSGGFKVDDEMGVKRPLMAPRRKFKYSQLNPERVKRRRICPCCSYPVSFISVFLGITISIVIFLCIFPNPLDNFRRWKMAEIKLPIVIPCTEFKSQDVWHQSFPYIKSESVMTAFESNGDSVLDIALGFATGGGASRECTLYDAPEDKCGGGVLALDGRTGSVLWKYWTREDVLYLDCSQNVNPDPTHDCLVSGKGGVLCVLDGKTGFVVWEFSKSPLHHRLDLYTAQYIFDLNDDGYSEVLISHTSDTSSHVVVLNGRNGEEIGQIESPLGKSIFSPPRVLHSANSTYTVAFGTGELDRAGALYLIPLDRLALSDSARLEKAWEGATGISSDLLLADLDADSVPDIVFSSGPSLYAISGTSHLALWNYTTPDSPAQILVDPTPGYFDDDNFPDLLVSELVGTDYPAYYSKSWVLSGRTGRPLLEGADLIGTGEISAPGLSLSFTSSGNDMFLYWTTSCGVPSDRQNQPFQFSQDTTPEEKSKSDLCKLRFNTSLENRLYLLSQHIQPPGVLVYSSKSEWDIEHNNSVGSYFSDERRHEAHKKTSSFRHKGGLLRPSSYLPQPVSGGQKKSSYPSYPEYDSAGGVVGEGGSGNRWQSPQVSYEDRLAMLGGGGGGAEGGGMGGGGEELPEDGRDERANYPREMMKRHAPVLSQQPSILPRALSTGTLVNGLNGSSVDVVFATFWEMASTAPRIFTAVQLKCIQQRIDAEKNSNNLKFLDMEMAREAGETACSDDAGGPPGGGAVGSEWGGRGIEGAPAGQLTIFRIKITGSCSELKKGEVCSEILPYQHQSFPRRTLDLAFKRRAPLRTSPFLVS